MPPQMIDIRFTVEEAAAARAWVRQETAAGRFKKKLGEVAKESEKLSSQMRRAMNEGVASMGKMIDRTSGMVLGLLSVSRAVGAISTKLDELETKSRDVGIAFDEAFRKFNIQANLQGLQAEAAQKSIQNIAVEMAMNPVEVAGIAEQLVSSGFTADQAQGDALRETVKLMVGTNNAMTARGEGAIPTKDLVSAMSSFMDNMGMEKAGESINKFAVVVQTAFKETNLQLEDMAAIAGEAAVFRGKMTPNQVVAMGSILKDTNPSGPENATAMRNIMLRMSAITEPTRLEAVKKLGLKPKDIDMIGEDVYTALTRLREGIQKLPEEQQTATAKVMFEERGVAPFLTMMQPGRIEEMRSRDKRFADEKQYEQDIATGISGKSAQARRAQAKEDIRLAESSQGTTSFEETAKAASEYAVRDRGMSEVEAALRHSLAWTLNKISYMVPSGETREQKQARVTSQAYTLFNFGERGGMLAAPDYQRQIEHDLEAGRSPYGRLPSSVRSEFPEDNPINRLGALHSRLKTDENIDADEASAASRQLESERQMILKEIMGNNFSLKDASQINKQMEELTKAIRDLIPATKDNTKATEQNTTKPIAPSQTQPLPKQLGSRVRGQQKPGGTAT